MNITRLAAGSLLIFASASALACNVEQRLIEAEQMHQKGKTFAAISLLQSEQESCPDNARIPLEIGNYWFNLADYKKASNIWTQALTQHQYPEKVALNVKLHILQADAKIGSRWSNRLLVKAIAKYNDTATGEFSAGLLGSATAIYTMRPTNLAGSPLKNSWFLSVSAFTNQTTINQTTTPDNLYAVTSGFNQRFGYLAAQTGLKVRDQNNVSTTSLLFKPAIRVDNYRLGVDLAWNLTDKTSIAEPYLDARYKPAKLSVEARFEEVANVWTHIRSIGTVELNLKLKPALQIVNDIEDGSTEQEISLQLIKSRQWTVKSSASLFQNSTKTWQVGSSVSWRTRL